jgi:SAM-dependent methyltransferase
MGAREAFAALHGGRLKQGPGSDASSARALALAPRLPECPEVLDLGCGPGRQTLLLARRTGGRVTAVDRSRAFLEALDAAAQRAGLAARIATLEASMDEVDRLGGPYDLVWCEGAAYALGFDRALALWPSLLRPGAGLALTELSWLAPPAPEARAFWARAYPGMRSREGNREALARAGLRGLGDFVLPASDWWEGYYDELDARIPRLRERLGGDAEALAVLAAMESEIDLYRRHGAEYGYVFYVAELPLSG